MEVREIPKERFLIRLINKKTYKCDKAEVKEYKDIKEMYNNYNYDINTHEMKYRQLDANNLL